MTQSHDRIRQYRYERPDGPRPGGERSPSGAARAVHALDEAREAEIQGFGMKLFLASLTMVFGGVFVAYLVIWWRNSGDWQSIVDTNEILSLIGATILLVAADLLSARALKAAGDDARAWSLTRTAALVAVVYLVVQSTSWFPLLAQAAEPGGRGGTLSMEGFLFLMLTFSHAVHVLGGIVANFVVLLRSRSGGGPTKSVLRLLYQYWRFLTIVWVVVLVTLFALGKIDRPTPAGE